VRQLESQYESSREERYKRDNQSVRVLVSELAPSLTLLSTLSLTLQVSPLFDYLLNKPSYTRALSYSKTHLLTHVLLIKPVTLLLTLILTVKG
jgi:hypothetical protein